MAIVQSYTKAGVDAKFNSRSNMTLVHSGGGTPSLASFPDAKTGDVIERSGDGARWVVLARDLNPISGRMVSDTRRPAVFSGPSTPPSSIPGAVVGDHWIDERNGNWYKITGV